MTALAASDSPQLYVPADQPYAWFTMPMLFWALGILAFAAAAGIGMCVAIVRRLNAVEDEHATLLANLALDAKKTAADVKRIDGDVALLFNAFNAAHEEAAEPLPLLGDIATSPSLDVAGEAARRVLEETPVGEPTRQMQTVNRELGGRTFQFRE